MTRGHSPEYESGDLHIDAVSGQVRHIDDAAIRLGPVKMKVLLTLLRRPGEVISRGEIFESVWGNQIVSEDALTRCVSDVRAELRKLSGRDDLIETLPKRGYRWRVPVREVAPSETLTSDADIKPATRPDRDATGPQSARINRLLRTGIAYFLALAATATVIVWAIDRVSGPGPTIIAVLPLAPGNADPAFAALIENDLIEQLIQRTDIEVLSRSAVKSAPPNPFPFFYFEFGVRWLVESELRKTETATLLSIAIVDARTGIVSEQSSAPVTTDEHPARVSIETIARFVDSQDRRIGPAK